MRDRGKGASAPISAKVAHVRRAPQMRAHTCHWPGCKAQVPPAMWGCRPHWYMLPKDIRDDIWRAYSPGQEDRQDPSRTYLSAAKRAQAWIAANYPVIA